MSLHEADESAIVPLLPAGRRRRHDDLAQAVLEQQPSMRRARQRPRREVRRRPRARQSLLAQGPDATPAVTDLARERDRADALVRVGTSDDELVALCDG